MNIRDKQRFIKNLTGSIAAELCSKARLMPEDWDGIELRELLAEKFTNEAAGYMKDKRGRRYRSYQNECIIRNL